ncbi:hypothetical protein BC941DRAFT_416295 [Chlamydoabsidia padenii]|nr:hypothetical protein BC941DRAFT_416295 [Chlamydoabsidia padenii]
MVYSSKNKPWRVTLLYASALLFTLSTKVLVQGVEKTHMQQDVQLNEHRHQETMDEETQSIRGQELYEQALQHLEPLIQSQHSKPIYNKVTILNKGTGVTGLYNIFVDTLWNLIDLFISSDSEAETDGDLGIEQQQQQQQPTNPSLKQNGHDGLLSEAKRLLETAGNVFGNKDALYLLAEMYFHEKYTQPRDLKLAFDYYQKLANIGNATAQQMVGFMYATGVGNVVQRDQGKALLHHTFAALGGDTAAEMTLGYRYLLGIGTDKSCPDAVYYYKQAAEKAIEHYKSGPPGGLALPLPKARIADDNGGVYGFGASVMTDKYHRTSPDKAVSIDEVLQYLRYLAMTKNDVEAQLRLGEIYYHGSRNVPRDFGEALYFFKAVLDRVPDGKKSTESLAKSDHGKVIGHAAGYLGKMFLRGEGVKANTEMAFKWFVVGAELQDSASMNGLGIIQLNGGKEGYEKALQYFKQAAHLKNSDARVNLALEYIKHDATILEGIKLFELAADSKHILAYWYLGQIHEQGIGKEGPSCINAVAYYKAIAERGDWLQPTMDNAYEDYMRGDRESALLSYMLAAERGYEIAQSNVAYLLDTDKVRLNIMEILGQEKSSKRDNYSEQLALIYYTRSANQHNVDSRVKMGDYYYRGIGTEVDYDKAASCYRVAAELEESPMAMWNLGWMYENGIGVSKDFHLAKRAYDNALTTNGNAYLPVNLSLIKLYVKYYWEWLSGGDVEDELFKGEHQHQNQQQQQQQQQDHHRENNNSDIPPPPQI